VTNGFYARMLIYPNNAFYSTTPIVYNLLKSFNTSSWDFVCCAQALHSLRQLKPTILNRLFGFDKQYQSFLFALFMRNSVVTYSRAFGLEPLPNQSLHGRMPQMLLVNHHLPVLHSP
jgi:hypothetical protein